MVEAATEFVKSGYSEEDSAQLAYVASLYQNVADEALTAGESANYIISQLKAFNLEASDSQHLVDALNEVSNNYAVSSADLGNNLSKVSAALSVGNNTYEQTLGLMTGIIEITRSGSRAARSLVSIQSRLNQIVDESSDTGKALTEWYNKHNIAVYDQEGQLRSLYDILSDVAEIWPDLTTNEKDYYLNQQAGANQTVNLAAALSNFKTVADATNTALNSTNSAVRENEAVMDSLSARVNSVKAAFQELALDVIDSELVKSILELTKDFLELADSGVGQFIIKFGLLTGLLTGGISLLGQFGSGVSSTITTIVNLASAISEAGGVMAALQSGTMATALGIQATGAAATGAATGFAALSAAALPLAAGVAAVIALFTGLKKLLEYFAKDNVTWEDRINSLNSVGQETKETTATIEDSIKRYEELSEKVSLTADETLELKKLQSELNRTLGLYGGTVDLVNGSLDENIKKIQQATLEYNKLKASQEAATYQQNKMQAEQGWSDFLFADTESSQKYTKLFQGEDFNQQVFIDQIKQQLGLVDDYTQWTTEQAKQYLTELLGYANLFGEGFAGTIQDAWSTIVAGVNDAENATLSYEQVLKNVAQYDNEADFTAWAMAEGIFDDAGEAAMFYSRAVAEAANTTSQAANNAADMASAYQDAVSSLDAVSSAYDTLTSAVDQYNEYGSISYDTLENLMGLDSEYLNMLEMKNGKLVLNTEALYNNAQQAQEAAVQARVQALAEEIVAIALGKTTTNLNNSDTAAQNHIQTMASWLTNATHITDASFNLADAVVTINSALSGAGAGVGGGQLDAIENAISNARKDIELIRSFGVGDHRGGGSGSGGAKSSAKSTTDAYKEAFDEWLAYKDHQLAMDEITEEEYYTALKQKNEEYFGGKKEYLDEYRKYAEKVYDWEKKQAEEQAKAAKEAYEKYLDDIKSKLDAVISYVTEYASRQIEALEKQIDAIDDEIDAVNDKYDAKIDALDEQNAALEKQIQLEQYLEALTRAKSTQKLVFKDGQFQYQGDVDAISAAQGDIDAFNREQALQDKKDQIEQERQNELTRLENSKSALEQEKERWQEYKDGWANLSSDYEYYQNELIAKQVLGIDLENSNWDTRLGNFNNFNQMYGQYQQMLLTSQQDTADGEASIWNERLAAACDFMNQYAAIMGTGMTYSYTPVGGSGAGKGSSVLGGGFSNVDDGQSYRRFQEALKEREEYDAAFDRPYELWGDERDAKNLWTYDYDPSVDYGTLLEEALQRGIKDEIDFIASQRNKKILEEGLEGKVESTADMYERLKEKYYGGAHASGTLSARGGLSLVGERGPELRVLSSGDGILPADITSNLWDWGSLSPTALLSSISSITNGARNNIFNIDNLSLPNVSDAQSLVVGLKQMAYQRAYKRA